MWKSFRLLIFLSKVDRFTSNKAKIISGPFYTYRHIHFSGENTSFLADRTNGRVYATVFLSVVCTECQPLRYIRRWISRKPLEIKAWFQRTTNRKWPMGCQMVTWPSDRWRHVTPKVLSRSTVGYPSDSLASCCDILSIYLKGMSQWSPGLNVNIFALMEGPDFGCCTVVS